MSPEHETCVLIFRALAFAARKHRHQRRKDDAATPYINHLIAVGHILTAIGGVSDAPTLTAAILHDTLEDTDATAAELEAEFGPQVRALVQEVTDDKRLPKEQRKHLQIARAGQTSPAARCVKLADKIANVQDLVASPPSAWSVGRKLDYVEWAEAVVNALRGANADLEHHFDQLCQRVRQTLEHPTPDANG
jgi:GTP diphosphokinase / guanosine-3',5'-bis(diphosphate) 3'-diphosphatase